MDFAGRIAQITKSPESKHGSLFETLVKDALAGKFERVEEWPEYAAKHAKYTTQDIGIDLVAYDSSGTKHAVQCKYRGGKSTSLRKSDIDSFLSACRTHKIEKMILAYVGPNLKPNVREVCRSVEIYSRRRLAILYNKHNTRTSGRKWNFPPTGNVSACGFNQAGIEIFGGRRQNRQRQLLSKEVIGTVVRELLQNSLDAKMPNTTCKVVFEHDKIDRDIIAAADLSMHMKACEEQNDHPEFFRNARKTLNSAQIDVIRVTDSNTIGLDDKRWDMCTITEGRSVKESKTAGGSFGLGKNAPFAMSGMGVVCYATRLPRGETMRNGDRTRSIAKCRAISHHLSGEMLQHVGELKSYEQTLARPGTSITVVGTRYVTSKKSWRQEFEDAVKRNFFIAITDGELECDVAGRRVEIDESTESDEAVHGRRRGTTSYLEAVRMYVGSGKTTLQSGGMSFDVWIEASARDGKYGNLCMYVNKKGMLITDETSCRRNPFHIPKQSHGSFLVLVMSSDDATEERMRAMEPPSHAEINMSRSPEHKSALKNVRAQMETSIRDILFADSDQEDVTVLSDLADILPIRRDTGHQTDLDAFVRKTERKMVKTTAAITNKIGNKTVRGGGGTTQNRERHGGGVARSG